MLRNDGNAPFRTETMYVLPQWVDQNGHMNVTYYVKAFDDAFYGVHDAWGLDIGQIEATGKSVFVAECHVRYLLEMLEGEPFTVVTQLIAHDRKRMHFYNEMHKADGSVAARCEWLILFVDLKTRKVTEVSDSQYQSLSEIARVDDDLPKSGHIGRGISIANRR
ncbi:MAG: thioesterase family protein [Fimbriimonadaceae bacterium]|nr:thioesterase family protein [Alphaproteobacteria bacterium]